MPIRPGRARARARRRPRTRAPGSEVSSPVVGGRHAEGRRATSASTGPTLTAAGRRLTASSDPRPTRTRPVERRAGSLGRAEDLRLRLRHCCRRSRGRMAHAPRQRRRAARAARPPARARARPSGSVAQAATRAMTVPARDRGGHRLPLAVRAGRRLTVADVDRALYDDRTLVKQLAMRRTLFVFPRDLLPAAWGSASARVAAAAAHPAGQGGRAGGLRRRRRGLARGRPRPRARAACAPTASAVRPAELRERGPELAGRLDLGARQGTAPTCRSRLGVLSPARGRGPDRARPQRRPLATLPAAVDADGGWLGETARARRDGAGTPSWSAAGCAPSGPAPRPTSSGGSGATKGAVRARWPTSGPSRSPSTAAAPAGCCPTTSTTSPSRAVGGAAAGARPDRDGLEGARLLPRPTHGPYSSTPTATPAPPRGGTGRIVGCWVQDADGVVVGAACSRTSAPTARAALDAEAERLTDVAGRAPGQHRLPVARDEGRACRAQLDL